MVRWAEEFESEEIFRDGNEGEFLCYCSDDLQRAGSLKSEVGLLNSKHDQISRLYCTFLNTTVLKLTKT